MTRGLVVHHFGPEPATVGGMATVIKVLVDHAVGGEIVDSHATWSPNSRRDTLRSFAASVRTLLRTPTSDVVHVHLSERGSFLREGALVALAHMRGHRTVATIHGASFMAFAATRPRLVSAVLRRADVVTCLDRDTLRFVGLHAPNVRAELMPNPVFVDSRFSPADETEELVVFAGEIGMRKGADVMHSAWHLVAQRRPQARCLMVGPIADFVPPAAARLEVRAAVGPAEMSEILNQARVVALPSRAEGMPMVLTEAMSLARPFVSTPVGGIPDLAREGGMLVPVGDAAALADCLTSLLADADLARRIGERGRRFCLETRSVEVVGARLRSAYAAAATSERHRHL